MVANMNRLHDMPPKVIEDLDEERPVGVIGLDELGWGYITMGPDIDPDSVPNDGWGFLLPQYNYYVPPTATTSATTVYTSSVDIHMSDRDTSSRGGHARLHVSLSRDHTCKHVVASSL